MAKKSSGTSTPTKAVSPAAPPSTKKASPVAGCQSLATQQPTSRHTRFPVEISIPVRFRDIDMMGHVNNAVFITMMEQARVEYFERVPGFEFSRLLYPLQQSFILAAIQCDFRAPIPYRATVRVRCGITTLGRSSFQMAYELAETGGGIVVATGSSVQVMYDYAAKKPILLPTALRRSIADLEGWSPDDPHRRPA